MCGIFGMMGDIPEDRAKEAHALLRNIFVLTQQRGTHASGFAAVFHDSPKLLIDKRPVEASKFVERSGKFIGLRTNMPAALIGHCRLSTSGKPEIGRNNHPFTSRHQTIVHNGKIDEWQKVAKELDVQLRTQTDSEIILKIADRYSEPFDAIKNIVEGTNDSPMALAILQHEMVKNRRLILYRNKERPLYVMRSKVLNSIFFTSTKEILVNAAKMTWKLTLEEIAKNLEIEDNELTPYTVLVVGLDENRHPTIVSCATINKTPKMLPALPPKTETVGEVRRPVIMTDITDEDLVGPASPTLQSEFRKVEEEMDARALGYEARKLAAIKATNAATDSGPPELPDSVIKQAAQMRFDALVAAAKDSATILRLVRDVPYMTAAEMRHWRDFRNKIST